MSAGGPFRTDARVERVALCAPPEDAVRIMARETGLQNRVMAYLAWIALGAGTLALTLPHAGTGGALAVLVVAGSGALIRWASRRRAQLTETQRASLPVRCAFTADGFILGGNHGESFWRYDDVREITPAGPWLVLTLRPSELLVLSADAPGEEPLAAFLARRASRLGGPTRDAQAQRRLAVLAVLYTLAVLAAVAGEALFARPQAVLARPDTTEN